jgi:hypothetical protein
LSNEQIVNPIFHGHRDFCAIFQDSQDGHEPADKVLPLQPVQLPGKYEVASVAAI